MTEIYRRSLPLYLTYRAEESGRRHMVISVWGDITFHAPDFLYGWSRASWAAGNVPQARRPIPALITPGGP